MPRFLFWSDLHMEFAPFTPPAPDSLDGPIDGVLIAGDTNSGLGLQHLAFAEEVADLYKVPVVLITGNHEYYGTEMRDFEARQSVALAAIHARGGEVHVLQGESITIKGARIIGATLWTDFELDPALTIIARRHASVQMKDYRHILIEDADGMRRLTVADTIALHQKQLQQVTALLRQKHDGPTLVMTHHMPIAQAISPAYGHDPVNAAFASNLMAQIRDLAFDVWIYGHSHSGSEWRIGTNARPKRFLTNPRGYPHEATRFDPKRIITL